jgi:hypothetical protein
MIQENTCAHIAADRCNVQSVKFAHFGEHFTTDFTDFTDDTLVAQIISLSVPSGSSVVQLFDCCLPRVALATWRWLRAGDKV